MCDRLMEELDHLQMGGQKEGGYCANSNQVDIRYL